ncbi:trichohyalin-like isoform X7 [Pecten maximus]|uniref:trichohyalin-like isoform X5 n=1 Tax=Pecten maximus TaxID=6579 RepID=UPI001458EF51|nr:trichohyalin-like isoform X5 [Pecten maximus]XP_033743216.1 trichohyalin-like isoform X7 [Pecten maximus]
MPPKTKNKNTRKSADLKKQDGASTGSKDATEDYMDSIYRTSLQNAEKEIEDLKAEIVRLKSEPKLTGNVKANNSTTSQQKGDVNPVDSENEHSTLVSNLQRYIKELKQSEEARKELQNKVGGLEERNSNLTKEREKQNEELKQLRKENKDVKENAAMKKLEERVEKPQDENKDLKAENTDIKRSDEQQMERERLGAKDSKRQEEAIEKLQNENARLIRDIEQKKQEVEQLQKQQTGSKRSNEQQIERERLSAKDRKRQEEEIEKLQNENARLLRDIEQKKQEVEQLQKQQTGSSSKKKEDKKRGNSSSAETISKLQSEVDGLRNRLSKIAGAQLVDNNPAIADLSDPNRPLSLGEKFSELYDNEWTDAMEEISDVLSNERDVIQKLLGIVFDAYEFCLKRSNQFMDKINNILSDFSFELVSEKMPKEIAKTNKDFRKSLSVHVVSYLQQEFTNAQTESHTGEKTTAYMKKCVLVCWFMTVQDPKVVIKTEAPEIFDEDRYRPYTKKGKRLDYLVWPVLHLHEGGPLISKGVAQGKL